MRVADLQSVDLQNISFSVSGPGSIYGVGNGDPSDHDPDKAEYRRAFHGLARVLVRSVRSTAATIDAGRPVAAAAKVTLTATADGLKAGSLSIELSA